MRYENGPAKVCVKLGESATVTSGKLQRAYGEHSLPRAQVLRWHKSCKLSPSQESENEQIQNQIDAHLFFDSQGIVHKEFVPPGQTVNQTFYQKVLQRLRKRVARVRPGTARTWMLHHDNAPCHTAVSINDFLAEKSIPVVPQAPIHRISDAVTSFYSPGSKTT